MLQCKKMQDAIAGNCISVCRKGVLAAVLAMSVLLSGCESVPDVVNPFSWFGDDEKENQEPLPASERDQKVYPKLGAVPKRPPSLETQQENIAEGLSADVENARYTDDKVQREAARRSAGTRPGAVPPAVPAPRAVPRAPRVPTVPAPSGRAAVPPPPSVQAPAPRAEVAPSLQVQRPVPPVPSPAARPSYGTPPPSATRGAPVTPPPLTAQPAAPSAQVSQLKPPVGSLLPPGQPVKAGTIYFADGSTKLLGADKRILSEIALAQRQTGSVIKVVGHASGRARTFDAARRHLVNYQVSLDRANAVAEALLQMGVPVGKLQVEGKGDTAPVYAEYTASGEAANRRAELYLIN